ncbi:IclR family transcriptional regulator domain-containing protein [Nocardia donostiensis]|uniref:Glycerol operon regulatory protein n=1 Tax=Nocardia donostiensis TaxID=1538463 RepID=A0A1W0B1E1_9NOCA|nr:IclR family transcriptional regulator C-terminal domain-containing protein [Nocardia donostiensis]ONM46777.1 IclR family transcriptional regulator [Nocardia donostiensis]OQS16251.1 IclR family transcriptional regulator [Nocardia donostiensis]OQS19603.1 IclR family transcriptional regulator [Nocardia donostiensis]
MSTETAEPNPDFVQSLGRGLAVIRAFDAEHPQRTLSDVARATGLTRATARRFLLTLAELGYVRSDGATFALTPRVLELGYAYLSSLTLPEIAGPHLEALSATVHESTSVSILDGDDVVYVARVAVSRIMTVAISIGTRFPAYATSMGRVLLAGLADDELDAYLRRASFTDLTGRTVVTADGLREHLAAARAQGYCLVDQELEVGLRSLAAPIHDPAGRVIAALNISTPAARYSLDDLTEKLIPPLRKAAAAIDADLARVGTTRGQTHA